MASSTCAEKRTSSYINLPHVTKQISNGRRGSQNNYKYKSVIQRRDMDIKYDLLSVQCNTLHGTQYKITCGVCLCVCVRARGLGLTISKTVTDREVRLQWDTNRK